MDPVELPAVGRGRLSAQAYALGRGVTVRIEDDDRPDFWCEVRIDADVLRALLAALDAPAT